MDDRGGTVMLGVALLALVWIGVYWVWQPGVIAEKPTISFAGNDAPAPVVDHTPPAEPAARPETTVPAEQSAPPPALPVGPVIEPPTFRDYTVRDGDTLEKIAQRELGRRSYWHAIAESNPLRDPRRLRPGDVIRIPIDPTNIQGKEVEPKVVDQPTPAPPDDGIPRYTVVSGDTLEGIAEAHYGDAGFGEFIFFNNRDVLDMPDKLDVGMVLKLPPL